MVPTSAAPFGAAGGELGSRGTQEQERAFAPIRRVLQQIEERRVGPVDVLDEDDDQSGSGQRGEERAPCGVEVIANLSRIRGRDRDVRVLQTDRVREGGVRTCRVRGNVARDQLAADLADLLDRELRWIGVEDAGLRLQDLPERPVRDALAVRQAPAKDHEGGCGRLVVQSANSSTRRVLPTPASPYTVTSCGRRSATHRSNTLLTIVSSAVRPTIGVR